MSKITFASTNLVPGIKTQTTRRNVFIRGINKTCALEQQGLISSPFCPPSEEGGGKQAEAEKRKKYLRQRIESYVNRTS